MKKPKSYTLCDFQCPIMGTCNRYCPQMDKKKTNHFGVNPFNYERNKCDWYEKMTDEELIERMEKLN